MEVSQTWLCGNWWRVMDTGAPFSVVFYESGVVFIFQWIFSRWRNKHCGLSQGRLMAGNGNMCTWCFPCLIRWKFWFWAFRKSFLSIRLNGIITQWRLMASKGRLCTIYTILFFCTQINQFSPRKTCQTTRKRNAQRVMTDFFFHFGASFLSSKHFRGQELITGTWLTWVHIVCCYIQNDS